MFRRTQFELLKLRIAHEPRRFIQVLYGPRQVGKTTLVKQYLSLTDLPTHFATADGMITNEVTWLAQQ